jgi:rhomboid family GlyGly-CTERM serine protease
MAMNHSAISGTRGAPVESASRWPAWRQVLAECIGERPESLWFVGLIAIFNAPLLAGACWNSMVFQDAALARGQWWRLLTHAFVHGTWYHLLLDGTAFLTLYAGLLDNSLFRRLSYVIAAIGGSSFASWAASFTAGRGLCGLSGAAHGLMAVSAAEMILSRSDDQSARGLGWISLALVTAKAAYEALSGKMLFSFLQFGLLGNPVAVSHAGGIIGGLVAWMAFRQFGKLKAENCTACGRMCLF